MESLVFPRTSSNFEQVKEDILNGIKFNSAALEDYSSAVEAQMAADKMYRSGILTREVLEQTMNRWKNMQPAYVPPYALVNTEMIADIAKENDWLKNENRDLKKENEKLKKMLDSKIETEWTALMKG